MSEQNHIDPSLLSAQENQSDKEDHLVPHTEKNHDLKVSNL